MIDLASTVAVDFDGVLHSYSSGWTGPIPFDPPVDGAQRFCERVIAAGFTIVIMTSRVGYYGEAHDDPLYKLPQAMSREEATLITLAREGIRGWLKHHGFPEPLWSEDAVITNRKVPGLAYIDDRAVRFTGPASFDHIAENLETSAELFIPWTRNPR